MILQNFFRKLSFLKNKFVKKFYKNKNKFNVRHNFCCGSSRNLGRSCNMWGRGGGRLEVHMNLMPPRVSKVSFFPFFWPSGRLLIEGLRAFQIPVFVSCNEKRHIQWQFCKEIALNKIILRYQARITYFFHNLIGKNHFATTLYVIGSFFPALAARGRVNSCVQCFVYKKKRRIVSVPRMSALFFHRPPIYERATDHKNTKGCSHLGKKCGWDQV